MTQVTYTNYSNLAIRTESPLDAVLDRVNKRPERFLRLLHSALGLDSELSELRDSIFSNDDTNTIGELGDMWWFVNIGHRAIGSIVDYSVLTDIKSDDYEDMGATSLMEDLEVKIAEFQDHIKAHMFYGREEFKTPTTKLAASVALQADLNAITVCLAYLTRSALCYHPISGSGDVVIKVMEANIAKLRARYPDSYSDVAANERNDSSERAAIDSTHASS
jgi:hypothetical protein